MKTIAILICVGLFVSDSKAFEFSNPIRSVSANNNKGSSDSKSTPDFGRFNESARVDWETSQDSKYSMGNQDSTITSDGITATGSATGWGKFLFFDYEPLHQSSSSYFQVNFEIDFPREITLTGTLDLRVDTGGTNYDMPEVWVTLSGQTGEIFSQHVGWENEGNIQINETFFLEAGLYTLYAGAETYGDYSRYNIESPGIGGHGAASYDITLTPEPTTLLLLGFGAFMISRRK